MRGPTPHSLETDSGARKARVCPAGTSSWPLGLATSLAIFATNLQAAMPAEAGSSSSRAMRARRSAAIFAGGPNSPTDPVTSRNASSSERGSTRGVTLSKKEKTRSLASA